MATYQPPPKRLCCRPSLRSTWLPLLPRWLSNGRTWPTATLSQLRHQMLPTQTATSRAPHFHHHKHSTAKTRAAAPPTPTAPPAQATTAAHTLQPTPPMKRAATQPTHNQSRTSKPQHKTAASAKHRPHSTQWICEASSNSGVFFPTATSIPQRPHPTSIDFGIDLHPRSTNKSWDPPGMDPMAPIAPHAPPPACWHQNPPKSRVAPPRAMLPRRPMDTTRAPIQPRPSHRHGNRICVRTQPWATGGPGTATRSVRGVVGCTTSTHSRAYCTTNTTNMGRIARPSPQTNNTLPAAGPQSHRVPTRPASNSSCSHHPPQPPQKPKRGSSWTHASVCRCFQVKQVKVVTYNVLSFTHVFFSLSL